MSCLSRLRHEPLEDGHHAYSLLRLRHEPFEDEHHAHGLLRLQHEGLEELCTAFCLLRLRHETHQDDDHHVLRVAPEAEARAPFILHVKQKAQRSTPACLPDSLTVNAALKPTSPARARRQEP